MSVASLNGLRPALPQDLSQIQGLIDQAYGGYVETLGVRPGPLDDDYATSIAAGFVQVLERAGSVVALLILVPQSDALLLDNIAVSPKAQGQGLARALLDHAEQQARAGGFAVLRLYTHERMIRNQQIYRHAGYHETRRVHERGLARVYMEKPIG